MDPAQAGLLPVPRLADGAVGRPGVDRLHRRHRHRRGARPQRPAPEPLLGHERRPRDHGLRGRRARHRSRRRSCSKGRLQPGRMFLVDTAQGRIVDDDEIKADAGRRAPLRGVARRRARASSTTCPTGRTPATRTTSVVRRQQTFGYTHEELKLLIAPMARTGGEALGSMGTDTPIAVLSDRPAPAVRLLLAAVRPGHQPAARRHPRGAGHQPRRHDRPRGQPARPDARRRAGRSRCRARSSTTTSWPSSSTSTTTATCPGFQAVRGHGPLPGGRRRRGACATRSTGSAARCQRGHRRRRARSSCCPTATPTPSCAPIPSLLLTSAVHHHLIREKTRTQVGPGRRGRRRPRGAPHGAAASATAPAAINPYLAFETIEDMIARGQLDDVGLDEAVAQLHQGGRQGRAQGDVEDGHLHRRVLHRRPGVRGHRPRPGARRRVLHRHHQPARRHRPRRDRRRGRRPPPHGLPRPPRASGPTASSRSAASTSGAARASTTSSTPRPCSSCSTPPAPKRYDVFKEYTRAGRRPGRRSLATLRGLFALQRRRAPAGADRRGRAGRRRSSSGSPPARCPTARSRRRPTRPSPSP